MKYFIMAKMNRWTGRRAVLCTWLYSLSWKVLPKFLKHFNLQICKCWYILCCGERTDTHVYQPTENL